MRERASYIESGRHERVDPPERREYCNGLYEREFVTRLGAIRLRIARTRGRNFVATVLEKFRRRPEHVAMLTREAILRGISTRRVGCVAASLTGEPVSAQTVSKRTWELKAAVRQFHQARP